MNSRVKEKWVAALRSGEYQQGRNSLRNCNGFCCLGVLCDIYSKETNKSWTRYDADREVYVPFDELRDKVEDMYDYLHMDDEPQVPPFRVWSSWAGMAKPNPVIQFPDGPKSLAELNDQGSSFEEIANLIEMYL